MKLLRLAFGASLMVGFNVAFAGTLNQNMNASTTVNNACEVVTAQNLAFGAYDPVAANAVTGRKASFILDVRCLVGTNLRIAFDQGQNPQAGSTCTAPKRQMTSTNGQTLRYDLYHDVNTTIIRGCATGVNDYATSNFSSASTPYRLTFYGLIPAGQDMRAGSFQDTVGLTLTF